MRKIEKISTFDKFQLWVVENVSGGELMVFEHFAKILHSEVNFFWRRSTKDNTIVLKRNFVLNKLLRILDGINIRSFKNLYSVIYRYFIIRLLNMGNDLLLISSSYIPIPKGKRIIPYVHTTPRFLNVDREIFMSEHNINTAFKRMIFSIFCKLFELNYQSSLHKSKLVLCNSKVTKERLLKYFNAEAEVLYFPIEVERYFKMRFEKFFIYCSRINSVKRQDYVLRAFEMFYKNHKDFTLVFISPELVRHKDIEYLNKIKQYSKERNLPVSFLIGLSYSRVIEEFSNCYVSLFAAKEEDFGRVIIESMACSKTVISVNEGGPREIIKNNENGFLVNSEIEMAEKMEMLANNPSINERMGNNALRYVKENFTDKVFLEKFRKILEKYY